MRKFTVLAACFLAYGCHAPVHADTLTTPDVVHNIRCSHAADVVGQKVMSQLYMDKAVALAVIAQTGQQNLNDEVMYQIGYMDGLVQGLSAYTEWGAIELLEGYVMECGNETL